MVRAQHRRDDFEPPLSTQAYERLRADIVSCSIPPGEWVTEAGLAELLAIGKTPTREALGRLSLEGLVTASHRRGYQVEPITLNGVLRVLEAYEILVPEVSVLVAHRATPRERSELGTRTRAWAAARPGTLPLEMAPYFWFFELCGNPLVTEMASGVLGRLERICNFALLHGALDDAEYVAAHNRAFAALVEGRDDDTIRRTARATAAAARASIVAALQASPVVMDAPLSGPSTPPRTGLSTPASRVRDLT